MRGVTGWQYRPYIPADRYSAQKNNPFVCRIAPAETSVLIEIIDDSAPGAVHVLKYRFKGADLPWQVVEFSGLEAEMKDLQSFSDYEFLVERKGEPEHRSALRFVRTGFYPDIVVNYLHPQDNVYDFSGHYLCDPTFVRVPSGALVAAMSLFGPAAPQDLEILFRSEDNGKTWHYLCDLFPAYWGTLFVHKGVLYMLGVTTENGHLVIGASYDEGRTWTKPVLLFNGGNYNTRGYQRQPMPVFFHNGKIITSVDYGAWSSQGCYSIGVLAVSQEADLLDASNWTVSDFTTYNPDWPSPVGTGCVSLLEGSVFQAADGKLVNMTRMQISHGRYGKACLLELDENNLEAAPKFHSVIDMPTGTNSRTHVLQDPVGGKYWAIGNLVDDEHPNANRTIMALSVSEDGYHWRVAKVLLDYSHLDANKVGFQYTSFIFDGDDILYLSRTSFNEANTYHDANCQTFGVVKDFRKLGDVVRPHRPILPEPFVKMLNNVVRLDQKGLLYEVHYTEDYYQLEKYLDLLVDAGCSTMVAKNVEGQVLMGRNYDYRHYKFNQKSEETTKDLTGLIVVVHGENPAAKYRSLGVADGFWMDAKNGTCFAGTPDDGKTDMTALAFLPFICMDGVNEKGLAVSIMQLPIDENAEPPVDLDPNKKTVLHPVLMRLMLDNCASVDEAVAFAGTFNLRSALNTKDFHILVCDSTGKSVILEWHRNIFTATPVNFSTNHYISTESKFGNGAERDAIIQAAFGKYNQGMPERIVKRTLELVSQNPFDGSCKGFTQWSTIYNLSDLSMKLWIQGDYEKGYEYQL